MKMVLDALEKAENENDRLIRDYAEAIRRIAQAEAVVKPSERFRIDDAKTKLKRMERHKQMAAGMCEMLRHDAQEMRDGQLRFEKPTLISAAPENGLFLQEAMDRLLRGEKEGRKELAAWFPVLVQGGKTADLRRTMKQLGRGAKEKDAPAVQLLLVAMETAMQEETAGANCFFCPIETAGRRNRRGRACPAERRYVGNGGAGETDGHPAGNGRNHPRRGISGRNGAGAAAGQLAGDRCTPCSADD